MRNRWISTMLNLTCIDKLQKFIRTLVQHKGGTHNNLDPNLVAKLESKLYITPHP